MSNCFQHLYAITLHESDILVFCYINGRKKKAYNAKYFFLAMDLAKERSALVLASGILNRLQGISIG
jgi:hypothetical protein